MALELQYSSLDGLLCSLMQGCMFRGSGPMLNPTHLCVRLEPSALGRLLICVDSDSPFREIPL